MKKILLTMLLSFVAIFAYSQVNYSFRGKANIYSATRGTGVDTAKWVVLAVFTDDMSYYSSTDLTVGDYIYTTSAFGCAALRVDTINSEAGGVFNLDVLDLNNVLTSISGQSFVFTKTPNKSLPTFAQGLPAQIQACIITDLALRIDAITGVSTGDKTDITVVNAETNWQIDAGVVGATELSTDAVTTIKITDLNVTTGKLAEDGVTNAKLDNMAANTIKGNLTGSSANPTDNTISSLRTALTIEDSTSNKLVVPSLTPNYFLYANGTRTATTTNSYISRSALRVTLDSLVALRLPRWTTAGRPASPLNGDMAYNATLNLTDIRINGAWRNGVVSDGALTSTRVPHANASGHLIDNASFTWTTGRLVVGTSATDNVFLNGGNTTLSGVRNTVFGGGTAFTSGYDNTYFGYRAGNNTTTTQGNTAFGSDALRSISTGNGTNIAIGTRAMELATAPQYCIAIGHTAIGGTSTPGQGNLAIGYDALRSPTATYNTAIGYTSVRNITSGAFNLGVNYQSLLSLTTGSRNLGLGNNSGWQNRTGSANISIGHLAGGDVYNTTGNTALGVEAGYATYSATYVIEAFDHTQEYVIVNAPHGLVGSNIPLKILSIGGGIPAGLSTEVIYLFNVVNDTTLLSQTAFTSNGTLPLSLANIPLYDYTTVLGFNAQPSASNQVTLGAASGTGAVTQVRSRNYRWNVDQTVGAAQDGYNMAYNHSSGEIELTAPPAESGGSIKGIRQTAHGFTAPEAVFWNTINYKNAAGVAGDTIRCSGVVIEVISADSFKIQFNGIHEDDFSLPEGMYYVNSAGTGGLSLTPDPDALIPAMQVENGYSVINPIVEDVTQGLTGTMMTLETVDGSRPFEFGETLALHRDSLIGNPLDSLVTETSTTPSTAAKYAIHLVDSSGGSKVVTPPASPIAGDWFCVSNSRGELVNTITVDTSTDKLHSAAADHVMVGGVLFARFTYVNSTIGWIKSN